MFFVILGGGCQEKKLHGIISYSPAQSIDCGLESSYLQLQKGLHSVDINYQFGMIIEYANQTKNENLGENLKLDKIQQQYIL